MKYRARQGVILAKIGDKALLISAKKLHDQIPYVTEINETTELCWQLMESGMTEAEIVEEILKEYETDYSEQVKEDIQRLFEIMYKSGYIGELRD